jgi:non-ribosomal peptide synthetase component F
MDSSPNNVLEIFFQAACVFPQKVAIELDDQIWTYAELLANVICVTSHLKIEIGQIICQYVERSMEMVCGLLGIMCAGGVYCPLNPAEPLMRTHSLIGEVQGRVILVHEATRNRFSNMDCQQIQTIDLEQILSMNNREDVFQKGNLFCIVE